MHRRGPAGAGQADPADLAGAATPDAARAQLVNELRHHGSPLSPSVQEAFAKVPRHVFVPEVGAAAAYRDEAFVIKCGPDGLPVSSSSQPAMMAIMLDQLGLRPGHRVLEIGTGTGYNAAVMSEVAGRRGEVVSIDIDPDLVARAQSSLLAAGYGAVRVQCADGGYGDPTGAPFDRIIVTAGAWDIAPAWLDQVGQGGRLVLPLSVGGLQLSVGLERAGQHWRSTSAWRCGFVRMLGAFAGPEAVLRLDGPQELIAQVSDGRPIDPAGLRAALAGPAADEPVPARLASLTDLADLDLWLTVTTAGLDRLTLLSAPGGWLPGASLLPFGGLVADAADPVRIGIAMLLPAELAGPAPPASDAGPAGGGSVAVVRGLGPGGPALAARLAGLAGRWAQLGRPGARELRLTVTPRGMDPAAATESAAATERPAGPEAGTAGGLILRRPSVTIEAGWGS